MAGVSSAETRVAKVQDVATGGVTNLLPTTAGQRLLRELQAAAGSQGLIATVNVQPKSGDAAGVKSSVNAAFASSSNALTSLAQTPEYTSYPAVAGTASPGFSLVSAPVVTNALVSPTQAATPAANGAAAQADSSTTSSAAVIGGAVGGTVAGVFLLIVLAVVLVIFCNRRPKASGKRASTAGAALPVADTGAAAAPARGADAVDYRAVEPTVQV